MCPLLRAPRRSSVGGRHLVALLHVLPAAGTAGNDVCNGHPGSSGWATPAEFKADLLRTLKFLDGGVLPRGSHVAFLPLVDGRVLYDTTHTLTHP